MAEITVFTTRATASRQHLLRTLAKQVPGLEFVKYAEGRPSVFTVRVGEGDLIELKLSQVEAFIAGLRIGIAHNASQLNPDETRRILAQLT